jgi:hypothetical protein
MSSSLKSIEQPATKVYESLCSMRKKYDMEKSTIIASVESWGEIHQHVKKNKHTDAIVKTNVLYMYPKRAAQYEVTYNKQLERWERNGEVLTKGCYAFIIDKDEKMFAYTDEDEAHFNDTLKKTHDLALKVVFKHSTLSSGRPVLFGGMYQIQDNTWDDQSGHYRPEKESVDRCKAWHKKYGITKSVYKEHTQTTIGKKRKSPSTEDLPSKSLGDSVA